MPGNILKADTGFPQFGEGQSTDEKINTIMNYLYMLLEQLRYSMGNLDEKNFNPQGLEDLGKVITEPLYVQLLDPETGLVTALSVTTQGLTTRMNSFNLNEFDAAATYGIGDFITNGGTVYRCIKPITTPHAWNSTEWEEMPDGSIETQHSELTQTVNGFTLQVGTSGRNSTIGLYNGAALISAGQIQLDGMVRFTDLDEDEGGEGYTLINGGKILSQVIESCSVSASTIIGGYVFGTIIHGGAGLYGPEVITREDTGQTETTDGTTRYVYQQAIVDSGEVSFGLIKRTQHSAYAAAPGGTPTDASIHDGQVEPFGRIYADYDAEKLYLTTKGTLNKPLKLESGTDMSIDAVPRLGTPVTIPGTGMAHGRIFIGGDQYDASGNVVQSGGYGQQVRIGGTKGEVIVYPAQELSGLSNVWEFCTDGIYYDGVKIVSV